MSKREIPVVLITGYLGSGKTTLMQHLLSQEKRKVLKNQPDDKGTMIVGRFVMTCCEEDISLFGFICDFEGATSLEKGGWISLFGIVGKDYAEKYDLWYPVIRVSSYEPINAPESDVIEKI